MSQLAVRPPVPARRPSGRGGHHVHWACGPREVAASLVRTRWARETGGRPGVRRPGRGAGGAPAPAPARTPRRRTARPRAPGTARPAPAAGGGCRPSTTAGRRGSARDHSTASRTATASAHAAGRQYGATSMTTGAPAGSSRTLPARSPCTSCDGPSGTCLARPDEAADEVLARVAGDGPHDVVVGGLEGEGVGPGPPVVAAVQHLRTLGHGDGELGVQHPGGRHDDVEVVARRGAGLVPAGRPAVDHPRPVAGGHRHGDPQVAAAAVRPLVDAHREPRQHR